MSASIRGVVLAAGAGRRLGLGPKAHVLFEGESLLARAVRCCREGGIQEPVVVGRIDDPRLAAVCAALGVEMMLNSRPEAGMFSSVRLALAAAIAERSSGLLLFPVDHPRVLAATVRKLLLALETANALAWVRPLHGDRHGHPVVIGAGLLPRLLDSAETVPFNEALSVAGGVPVDVVCDDPGVVMNINAVADLVRAVKPTAKE